MSVYTNTRNYSVELAESALDSFSKQARGTLEAPTGDESVRLYTAKGGSALTFSAGTTSAAVVFDPEASLRNGQMGVVVYERNAANTVTNARVVNLGRAAEDFLSVGVLSSGLKVFNSSGSDVIGGTQSAAVLTSVPRDISAITTTDLSNFSGNHERDLVSGVISRDDATMTMVMTEHFGGKMCLARPNTQANVVSRNWDDSVGTRRSTTGQSLGPIANLSLAPPFGVSVASTDDALLAAGARIILDTNNLAEVNNPLTLATYRVSATGFCNMKDPDIAGAIYQGVFRIVAYDAAGKSVGSSRVSDFTSIATASADNIAFDLRFNTTIVSTTRPIARVVAFFEAATHSASSDPPITLR